MSNTPNPQRNTRPRASPSTLTYRCRVGLGGANIGSDAAIVVVNTDGTRGNTGTIVGAALEEARGTLGHDEEGEQEKNGKRLHGCC